MPSHDVNLSDWLATPEGPPERIWQTALQSIEPEDPAKDPADEAARDHGLDEAAGDSGFEDGDLGLADAEAHTADEGAPMSYDAEDFGVDPFF